MSKIQKLTMPKWGLSMAEGTIARWNVEEGAQIERGMEVLDVETEKIANAVEASIGGVLRRKVVKEGDVVPVSGLLAVLADPSVPDSEIDAFIAEEQANFVPPAESEEDTSPKPQTIDARGHKLRYLKRGEGGTPVVLIHGFGGDLNNWLFNHEALAAGRTVYALDLPGHGESSKQLERGDVAELADAVVAFMDGIGIESAHLVGHSLGGAVAMQAASAHRSRVASLTLICSAGLGEEINSGYIKGFVSSKSRGEIKPYLQQLFADPALVTRQLVDDILKYKRLDGVDEALRKISDAAFSQGKQAIILGSVITASGIPLLVIAGDQDAIIPASHAQTMENVAKVRIIPGKGHMVQMEAAAEVNSLIEEFIS